MDISIDPLVTQAVNTATLLLLGYGILERRRPKIHVPVMLVCLVVDLANVVAVEITARSRSGKGAVEQGIIAVGEGGLSVLDIHVAVSTLVLIGYACALISGIRLLRGAPVRRFHRANAIFFVAARIANYVTSFFV